MTDWESIYRRYRDLEDRWAPGGEHAAVVEDMPHAALRNQQVRARVFGDPNKHPQPERPSSIDEEVWAELGSLSRELDPLLYDAYQRGASGHNAEDPYDNVYHAAVTMLVQADAYQVEPGLIYYRGQNYPWRLIELRGYSAERARAGVEGIFGSLRMIFHRAKEQGIPTSEAADRLAEERIREVSRIKPLRVLPGIDRPASRC